MKLKFYGLKDDVTGEFIFFFQSQNEGTMKRVVKGALLDKHGNAFTHDIKDKKIYDLGSIDTQTGIVEGNNNIVFVCGVNDVRLDLIREIKIAKAEAGEKEPNADEVVSDE